MGVCLDIRRDVNDTFYRYKMPRIQSKIEGKGNGIKTVIPNMSEVSRSLCRSPIYVTKFFGFELGAQTSTNAESDRYIVNGAHDAGKLQDLLDVFIAKFVLCGDCKNPETEFIITKDKSIVRDCKACGSRTHLDPRHKLYGAILKNPPEKERKTKKPKRNGADREDGVELAGSDDASAEEEGIPAGSDDEFTREIQESTADLKIEDQDKLVDWAVDLSADAVKARTKALEGGATKAAFGDDDEDGEDETGDNSFSQFGHWIVENKENVNDVEVYKKATELGIETRHRTMQVLAQTLFDENILKQIGPKAPLLKKMITSEKHQKALLGGTERLVGLDYPQLIPAVPKILMAYYEYDLISEDVV
ncbi:putative eukaryotic translation initiation factor 5, partial [Neolecta irregularis DAH-3]